MLEVLVKELKECVDELVWCECMVVLVGYL